MNHPPYSRIHAKAFNPATNMKLFIDIDFIQDAVISSTDKTVVGEGKTG